MKRLKILVMVMLVAVLISQPIFAEAQTIYYGEEGVDERSGITWFQNPNVSETIGQCITANELIREQIVADNGGTITRKSISKFDDANDLTSKEREYAERAYSLGALFTQSNRINWDSPITKGKAAQINYVYGKKVFKFSYIYGSKTFTDISKKSTLYTPAVYSYRTGILKAPGTKFVPNSNYTIGKGLEIRYRYLVSSDLVKEEYIKSAYEEIFNCTFDNYDDSTPSIPSTPSSTDTIIQVGGYFVSYMPDNRDYEFSIVDNNIAYISEISYNANYNKVATVKGLNPGTTTLEISYNSKVVSRIKITVKSKVDYLQIYDFQLKVGESQKIYPNYNWTSDTPVFKWSSSNTKVATVDQNGNIAAKSVGTAKIKVVANDLVEATCTVTVYNNYSSITLSNTNVTMNIYNYFTLSAQTYPNNQSVYWRSTNESILTVDSNGGVYAVGYGTAEIIATSAYGDSAKCKFNINPDYNSLRDIWIISDFTTIYTGEQKYLDYGTDPGYVPNLVVSWYSSDNTIATVDKNGKVTAKNTGNVTITCVSTNGKSDTINITVKKR